MFLGDRNDRNGENVGAKMVSNEEKKDVDRRFLYGWEIQ